MKRGYHATTLKLHLKYISLQSIFSTHKVETGMRKQKCPRDIHNWMFNLYLKKRPICKVITRAKVSNFFQATDESEGKLWRVHVVCPGNARFKRKPSTIGCKTIFLLLPRERTTWREWGRLAQFYSVLWFGTTLGVFYTVVHTCLTYTFARRCIIKIIHTDTMCVIFFVKRHFLANRTFPFAHPSFALFASVFFERWRLNK